MRSMATGERFRLTAEQLQTLFYFCKVGTMTEAISTSGGISKTYVDGSPQPCSVFSPQTTSVLAADKVVSTYAKYLRIRRDITINVGDRITLVQNMSGDPMVNEVFYVQAPGTVHPGVTIYPLDRTVPA